MLGNFYWPQQHHQQQEVLLSFNGDWFEVCSLKQNQSINRHYRCWNSMSECGMVYYYCFSFFYFFDIFIEINLTYFFILWFIKLGSLSIVCFVYSFWCIAFMCVSNTDPRGARSSQKTIIFKEFGKLH